ncbi:MAG: class I SAM-dependent methyltransferase [Planctomycetota bacterium]
MPADEPQDAASAMDRMYRYTRHVYDLSRKYYLLGRDGLLDRLADDAIAQAKALNGQRALRIVEVGCGTGRNLIALRHRLNRRDASADITLYGVDAASVMIETAQKAVDRRGYGEGIVLRQGLAQELSPAMFDLDAREAGKGWVDGAFFSYSLSMIPPWAESLAAALAAVGPGGAVRVVDFYDQAALPGAFAWVLKRWLAAFHVHYRPELVEHMEGLAASGEVALEFEEVGRRYAYRAKLTRPG